MLAVSEYHEGPMTWKQFKESVEQQGVTDTMSVDYIDVNPIWDDEYAVNVVRNRQTDAIASTD